MSYSNSYYSLSKAQFERPTIPPILKLAQQNQQSNNNASINSNSNNSNTKSNIFSNNRNKLNSILSLNTADAEKKFLRQKKLLQEQILTTNKANAVLANSNNNNNNINCNLSSLATAFPGFYLNPTETNYVKLINSILKSKLKPSSKLAPCSPVTSIEVEIKQTPTKRVSTKREEIIKEEEEEEEIAIDSNTDKLRSNSCLNMHSIDEESSNMMFDSSLSMSGAFTRSKTDFDFKIKPIMKKSSKGPKSSLTSNNNRLSHTGTNKSDVNYRLSNVDSQHLKNGLSNKFFVSLVVDYINQ